MHTTNTIDARNLRQLDGKTCTILDVRTPMEHAESHIAMPHRHVPLDMLDPQTFMQEQGLPADAPVYLLCRSGKRAQQAADKFAAAGYPNVTVIAGGIMACVECGLETAGHATKTAAAVKTPLSLERQVRIVAGALVFLGTVASLYVDTMFAFVPMMVGAGLVFAGVTDRCGLVLLLTKAPWNRVAAPKSCCAINSTPNHTA